MGKKSNKKYSFSRALSRAREAMTSIQTRDDIDTNQPRSLFLARICSARSRLNPRASPNVSHRSDFCHNGHDCDHKINISHQ
jgi:hypothetical protein